MIQSYLLVLFTCNPCYWKRLFYRYAVSLLFCSWITLADLRIKIPLIVYIYRPNVTKNRYASVDNNWFRAWQTLLEFRNKLCSSAARANSFFCCLESSGETGRYIKWQIHLYINYLTGDAASSKSKRKSFVYQADILLPSHRERGSRIRNTRMKTELFAKYYSNEN